MFRFAITILLSAFLLFLVQPMIGKYILPWFGGGAGVWTVCLLFFQTMLLVGYAYAHIVHRWLPRRAQMIVHIALLSAAIAFLPIVPDPHWKPGPESEPISRILLLLLACLGLPYGMLATTGPLVQAWFADTFPTRSPYRLYALSNTGSLLALGSYPFVFEPLMTRHAQALIWAAGFVVFAILCAVCAAGIGLRSAAKNQPQAADERGPRHQTVAHDDFPMRTPTPLTIALWVLLPMCASVTLLSATARLTEDVAPVPFLWILPLAVYLLSFIACFEWPRLYRRGFWGVAVVGSLGLTVALTNQPSMPIAEQIGLYLWSLLTVCMVCHGEAYRMRPPASHLTGFYLAIAAGGALGGAFVSIVAPLIFKRYIEFDVAIFVAAALLFLRLFTEPGAVFYRGARRPIWLTLVMLGLLAVCGLEYRLMYLGSDVALRTRNFYGQLNITLQRGLTENAGELRVLNHGWIKHGAQVLSEQYRRMPTLYYSQDSAIGRVMARLPPYPIRIGVIGLGAGTLASYGRPGDTIRYYEINPEVVRLATDYFSFLQDSPAKVEIALGDARLSLEAEPSQNFEVLVLDAFSGDAIPLHLLTREAFAQYRRHLASDGVIAVHISNKYLDLFPVVCGLARDMGFRCLSITTERDPDYFVSVAEWVLVTQSDALLDQPEMRANALVNECTAGGPAQIWTDEHASVFSVLR
jgi:hypothetical protein